MKREEQQAKHSVFTSLNFLNSSLMLLTKLFFIGLIMALFVIVYVMLTSKQFVQIQQAYFTERVYQVSAKASVTALRTTQYFAKTKEMLDAITAARQAPVPTGYQPPFFLINLLQNFPPPSYLSNRFLTHNWAAPPPSIDTIDNFGALYPILEAYVAYSKIGHKDILYFEFINLNQNFMVVFPSQPLAKLVAGYTPVAEPYLVNALAAVPGKITYLFSATELIVCETITSSQAICVHLDRLTIISMFSYKGFAEAQFYFNVLLNDGTVIAPSSASASNLNLNLAMASNLTSTALSTWNSNVQPLLSLTFQKHLVVGVGNLDLTNTAFAVASVELDGLVPLLVHVQYYEYYLAGILKELETEKYFNFELGMILMAALFGVDYVVLVYFLKKVTDAFIKEIDTVTFKLKGSNQNEMDVDLKLKTPFKEIDQLRTKLERIVVLRRVFCPVFYENKDQLVLRYQQALAEFIRNNDYKRIGIIHYNNGLLKLHQKNYNDSLEGLRNSVKYCEIYNSEAFNIPNVESFLESRSQFLLLKKFYTGSLADYQEFIDTYSSRLYTLAVCLIRKANLMGKTESLPLREEAISIFRKVGLLEEGKYRQREIESLFHALDQFLLLEDKPRASGTLKLIKQKIQAYEGVYHSFLQYEKHIPPEIFTQKFEHMIGRYYRERVKDNHNAVNHFRKSIQEGRFYDKKLRIKTLRELQNIYLEEKIVNGFVPKQIKIESQEANNPKDLVILLDYSNSMEKTKRKYYAIKLILEMVRKFLKPYDALSLVTFNYKVETIFELLTVGDNKELIEDAILKLSKEPAVGETCLYQAIYEGLNQLSKKDMSRTKIILCLTDGADNCSNINVAKTCGYLKAFNNPFFVPESETPNNKLTLSFLGFQLTKIESSIQLLAESTETGTFMKSTYDFTTDSLFCAQMTRSFNDQKQEEEHFNLEQL